MWTLLIVLIIILAILGIGLRLYLSPPTRWCRSQQCLIGKTTVITGANTGIGYETALDFAKRGAKVILVCRDKKKAEDARRNIIDETGNSNIFIKIADFASFDSIRAFAQEMYKTEDRLDILVNNSGITFGGTEKTKDGYDFVMQVNYYSHFLLTILLLELMKKTDQPSRVVNTSSLAAAYAKNFRINNIDKYTGDAAMYANSKLCNILFTKELAKRLRNTKITTYSLHPGAVRTDIFRNAQGLTSQLLLIIVTLFYKSIESGAQTTIYCSVEKNLEMFSGEHFDNCRKVQTYRTASGPGLPQKLWGITEEIVGLKNEEKFDFDM